MNCITFLRPPSNQGAYQVVPDPNEPVILQLNGNLCRVEEIGAAGFTCHAEGIESGRRTRFAIGLPTVAEDIEGYVDVVPLGEGNRLRCQFSDLSAEDIDSLHHYALVRQKEVLRMLRSERRNWR